MEKPLLRVAVSGAAGQIAQHLLFMVSIHILTLALDIQTSEPLWTCLEEDMLDEMHSSRHVR